VVAASFGLEAVVRTELEALGIAGARAEDRRVIFEGSPTDIARCNVCLRTADRVLVRLAEFPAAEFDSLYEGVRAVPWRDLLPGLPAVTVNARSAGSRLTAVPSIQSVAKKAIVDALSGGRASKRLEETGPAYDVELSLRDDTASVSLDTTGPGLHKRGYRRDAGEAPLRENLAAALVLLSRWNASRPFADPLCGSGTIAIEAALLAAGIAPGVSRTFAGEQWPLIPPAAWREARERARAEETRGVRPRIAGADRDGRVIEAAGRNAKAAGVADLVSFRAAPLEAFRAEGEYGCLVCNPPYGERIGSPSEVRELYRAMGKLYQRMPTWSLFALSAHEDFQKLFGARASRNRKLYNGNIRCWYYQYFGPLPPRDSPRDPAGSLPPQGSASPR
jgi:putative N6-adenine-specific DNA methylase